MSKRSEENMVGIKKVLTKDGETRYRVRVVTGHKPDGTAIREMRTYNTRREAETESAKWEADVARGVTGTGSRLLLGAYLDQWLDRRGRRVRQSTLHSYRAIVAQYMTRAHIAGVPLGKLTPAEVQRWIDAIPHAAM